MSVKIQIVNDKLIVSFSYSPQHAEKIKQISGNVWHPDRKYWTIPYTRENLNKLFKTFSGAYIDFGSGHKPKSRRSQKSQRDYIGQVKRFLYLLVK